MSLRYLPTLVVEWRAMPEWVREGKGRVPVAAHQEGLRTAELLKARLKALGVSVREVEKRLEWGSGTLQAVFDGRQPVRISHIASVSVVVDGFDLARFYRDLAADLEPAAPGSETIQPGLTAEEVLRTVRTLLQKYDES